MKNREGQSTTLLKKNGVFEILQCALTAHKWPLENACPGFVQEKTLSRVSPGNFHNLQWALE